MKYSLPGWPQAHRTAYLGAIPIALLLAHTLVVVQVPHPRDAAASCLITLLENLFAVGCLAAAARRAEGIPRLLWWLSAISLLVWAVVNLIWLIRYAMSPIEPVSSLLAFSYRLYAAPISYALFLRARDQSHSSQSLLLDFLQIVLIVTLVFLGLFYVPTQMLSGESRIRLAEQLGNGINFLLALAVLLRWRFEPNRGMRSVYARILIFVATYALISVLANRIEAVLSEQGPRWVDLVWSIPYLLAGVLAFTWRGRPDDNVLDGVPNVFRSLLFENVIFSLLVLAVAILSDLLQGRWHIWGNFAVAASLLIYALRLTFSQHQLEREVQERKAAEAALRLAHDQLEDLLAEAQLRETELQQLGELVRMVQSCLSDEEACHVIAEGVRHLLPETSGAIYSIAAPESAYLIDTWGVSPPSATSFTLDQCWAARSSHLHANIRQGTVLRCSHLASQSTHASLCVPLAAPNDTVGLMVLRFDLALVAEADPMPAAVRRANILLDAVARHVAPALANLRLRQSLRDQAVRDALTGLFNRRYLEETLDREVRRAVRRSRPLAVLMLDLDHFKSYNDRYGHPAGDHVLRLVGDFLRSRVRAEDIACRYGGEEFVIILPEATPDVALQRAEELRAGIKQLRIVHETRVLDHITVSIGLASSSAEVSESASLLRAADAALYQSKEKGRDRVTVASPILPAAAASANSSS